MPYLRIVTRGSGHAASSLLDLLRNRALNLRVRGRPPSAPPPDVSPAGADATDLDEELPFRVAKERAVSQWEREYITALVRRHGGNLSQAARAARMDRKYLRELVLRYRVR